MNAERMILKGQLTDAKKRLRELDLHCSGFITIIRQDLNPYSQDVTTLNIDQAAAAMETLKANVVEMRELKERIARMEEDLNG